MNFKSRAIAALEELKGDATGIIAATIEDCQQVIRDIREDAGYWRYHEIDFCPNCGARMKGATGIMMAVSRRRSRRTSPDGSITKQHLSPAPGRNTRERWGLRRPTMTDRVKLINMIQSAVDGCPTYWAGFIADHLLANGVTVHKPGRWIRRHNETKCSNCQFFYFSHRADYNYCPKCGARMKGAKVDHGETD